MKFHYFHYFHENIAKSKKSGKCQRSTECAELARIAYGPYTSPATHRGRTLPPRLSSQPLRIHGFYRLVFSRRVQ